MAPPGARAKVSSDDRGVTRRVAVAREPATAPHAGIDPASPTPLYHQIFSLLRGKIYDGQYPGGSFLPSEQELSAEFNVSRITAKRALDELAADGLVVREQGRGTRVCINTHSTSVRGSVKGLVHSLHANGRGSVQLLDFDYLPASEAIAAQLGLNVGDEVQRAIRIWHGEEGPFSHLTTFVPGRLGRSWTGEDLMRRPLISLLENTGVTIARAEERITAVLADARRRRAPRGRRRRAAPDDHANGVRYPGPFGRAPDRALSTGALSVLRFAWSVIVPAAIPPPARARALRRRNRAFRRARLRVVLLRLDAGVLHDLLPQRQINLDRIGDLRRAAAPGFEAHRR